jgi:hypothetical protein
MKIQEAKAYVAMAKEFHKDHGGIGAESFESCTAVVCMTANKIQNHLTKHTERTPEPAEQVATRKRKQRTANRLHLQAHGWDGDSEAFVTAWRNGINEVNWKRKGSDDGNTSKLN